MCRKVEGKCQSRKFLRSSLYFCRVKLPSSPVGLRPSTFLLLVFLSAFSQMMDDVIAYDTANLPETGVLASDRTKFFWDRYVSGRRALLQRSRARGTITFPFKLLAVRKMSTNVCLKMQNLGPKNHIFGKVIVQN